MLQFVSVENRLVVLPVRHLLLQKVVVDDMVYPKFWHLIKHITNAIDVVSVNMCYYQIVEMTMKRICNDSFYFRGETMAVHHHRIVCIVFLIYKAEYTISVTRSGKKKFHIIIE